MKKEETVPRAFYEDIITLILKPEEGKYEKMKLDSMKTDIKLINRIKALSLASVIHF